MGIKEDILKLIEVQLKAAVESHSDSTADLLLNKLKEAIPGQIDDAIIEAAKPQLKAAVKAELLKLVDKISAEV